MTQQRYMLDTNICVFWLRDKFDVKDFKNITGIKIENWIDGTDAIK